MDTNKEIDWAEFANSAKYRRQVADFLGREIGTYTFPGIWGGEGYELRAYYDIKHGDMVCVALGKDFKKVYDNYEDEEYGDAIFFSEKSKTVIMINHDLAYPKLISIYKLK